jgi:hypothetical protein
MVSFIEYGGGLGKPIAEYAKLVAVTTFAAAAHKKGKFVC